MPTKLAPGERIVGFFERGLTHVKGEWAGEPFRLQPWQRDDILRPLFGTLRPDGLRQYRRAYVELARKNGKSTLAAGIALYLLYLDGEPGAEVYSVAADREQAAIVFDMAKSMVEASPMLAKRSKVYRRAIFFEETMSVYRVLSADAPTKHGLNPHGIIFDELHAQPNRELWDVMTTGMGARRQPLLVAITTAGWDRQSICWEQHEYARQVLEGTIEDPAFFAYIAAADVDDDWRDEAVWRKANPSYGVTVKGEYLAAECERARQVPAYQNTFRRLHLSQWTEQAERWLDITAWDACDEPVDLEALEGRECYAGLDLASTTDIAALVLVFPDDEDPPGYDVLPFFWVPADTVVDRTRRSGVNYEAWVLQGLIEATPGNVIDYKAILARFDDLAQKFDIMEVGFDRWGATQLVQDMGDAGLEVVPIGQGFASMSAPTKELLNLVLSKRIRHGGHPVLRWMAGNMVVKQDPAGNLKPDKSKSSEKIDGMVALVMATDRATRHAVSAYEERGMLVL